MGGGNRIILVRHGETDKKENLIKDLYLKKAKIIANYMTLFKNYKTIHFICSPIERCIDTADILISEVNNLLNTNYVKTIDEKLRRWDKEIETREDSYNRAIDYSKSIENLKNCLIILTSNSSIIPKLAYGLVKGKYKKKEFKEIIKNKKKLIKGSVCIINIDKSIKYNIGDDEMIETFNKKNNI